MGEIADEIIEGMLWGEPDYEDLKPSTRDVLHRFSDETIKDTTRQFYAQGMRSNPKFQAMTIDIMNKPGKLSYKQKNVLISFIIYAK